MMFRKIFFLAIIPIAALMAVGYFIFSQKEKLDTTALFIDSEVNITLSSPYNSSQMYDESFAKLSANTEPVQAKAGIVSHHLLAKDSIAQFYNQIASNDEKIIFLISPDHYNHFYPSGTLAYTSKAAWDTPYGKIETAPDVIDDLIESGQVKLDTPTIGLEHGIYTEIPFIKKFFPNAEIVPLVLDSTSKSEDFASLGQKIKSLDKGNFILLVSSDFSHETSFSQAFKNDSASIDELKNLSTGNLESITNDCKQCVVVLKNFLEVGDYGFNLTGNTNSFEISGQDPASVTSYVFGYFAKKSKIQILFAGDLMFDRGIRYYAQKNGSNEFIFQKIRSLLENQDLVVLNLEGPITDNNSISLGTVPASQNNYTFTFDPSIAKTLYSENIRLVNLGNNHILNFGDNGLSATKTYLDQAKIDYFGSPDGPKSIIKNLGGIKIAFVGYNEFSGSGSLDKSQTISEIQKLKAESDLIAVYCHWDAEYQTDPTQATKELAHQFINAGADLVIGSHPHVKQTIETYNGKQIYYSLGNFVFDQYFSDNTRNGLGVIVKIDPTTKATQFEDMNFYLNSNGQTIIKE
jgi:poly-gamma-glutamate synthesis protein (capsule biosynthesis protein)